MASMRAPLPTGLLPIILTATWIVLATCESHEEASQFKCFGTTPDRRACLLSNLYYNIETKQFNMVGWNASFEPLILRQVALTDPNTIKSASLTPPDSTTVDFKEGLNVFWGFNGGTSYSIGHALVHGLFPLYVVLNNLLGDDIPERFNIIGDRDDPPAVFDHISLRSRDRILAWKKLREEALKAGKKWLKFQWAILGEGDVLKYADAMSNAHHPNPSFFNNVHWWGFRAWVYRSAGLDPDYKPLKPRVILNDKKEDTVFQGKDRRRIANVQEVVGFLKTTFPDLLVDRINFPSLSWRQQLAHLQTATIFITTEGSSSFRYVFLPRDAVALVLAHPDVSPDSNAEHVAFYRPYHEIDKFFPVSYFQFLPYDTHVNDTQWYDKREKLWNENDSVQYALYDANIKVNPARLEVLIRFALDNYKLSQQKPWTMVRSTSSKKLLTRG